jgi:uncharacterized membrane protein YfcA
MGIGGGTILIPALSIIYGIQQQTAQNINLIYFIPTAVIALITHIKQGNIEKKPLPLIIAFGLIGAAAGSWIAMGLKADTLRRCFGFFLLAMGAYEFFKKEDATERSTRNG